jgi:hypothetical protein
MRKQVTFSEFMDLIPMELFSIHHFHITERVLSYHVANGFLSLNLPDSFYVEFRPKTFTIYTDTYWFSLHLSVEIFHFGLFS